MRDWLLNRGRKFTDEGFKFLDDVEEGSAIHFVSDFDL